MDPRILKTRSKLYEAYLTLLQEQPQDTITIQLLTARANLNRVTFYKHFQNIAQFHEQFKLHFILELYEFMKPLNYKTYAKGFELEALRALLIHIKENRTTYKVLFTSPHIPDFNKELLAHFQQRISKHTAELAQFDFPGTGVDQVIVAWYGASALFGTIIMWAQADFMYAPEQLAKSIVQLAPHNE